MRLSGARVPLYEFQCRKCQHRFERIQKFSDADPKCPQCGGKVERLLHAPAVQFKGSGWYVTDYARAGAGKADKSEDESASTESAAESSASKAQEKAEADSKRGSKSKHEQKKHDKRK
jgi:putative FmdB family regulatory protein